MSHPKVFCTRSELQDFLSKERAQKKRIGFVPTMGALHAGHAKLIEQAVTENDLVVVSIFVNPKQFGPNEDYGRYPRMLTHDLEVVAQARGHVVFAPTVQEMYPESFATDVRVRGPLTESLCGAFRPGHFDGVATVVLLLLNLVMADKAYFGMKDFQQLQMIRRMCADLAHPTAIVGVPTVREDDGLALSSRNMYLDAKTRQKASAIPRALAQAAKLYLTQSETRVENLMKAARNIFHAENIEPQYLEVRDMHTFLPVDDVAQGAVMAVAVKFSLPEGSCRLIDNIVFVNDAFYRGILEELVEKVQV